MRTKGSKKKKQKPRSKICPSPLPRQPYTWLLMMFDREDTVRERHVFYSLTEDRYYVRFVPELRNKDVTCCPGGWMVLLDKSTYHCSILNISTMEKLQLPTLQPYFLPQYNEWYTCPPDCILSSTIMDGSCRILFFYSLLRKFRSFHLGDSEFVEVESTYNDEYGGPIIRFINFRGRLYALACFSLNLMVADFSDPDLYFELVVSGESLDHFESYSRHHAEEKYLVESCGELLLIFIAGSTEDKIWNVGIFRADFSSGEWVEHKRLGDRAIFLDSVNTFSSPASAFGLKSNALYWIRAVSYGCCVPSMRHLYVYDIEEKSVSVSLPCPIAGTFSPLSWFSLPVTTCNEEKPEEKKNRRSLLFEAASTIETNFNLQPRNKSKDIQIKKLRITKNKEEIVEAESSLWAYLPDELLTEIFLRLFAGDRVTFHSVCRSWYSVSLPSMTGKQLILPLMESSSDSFSPPFLMWPGKIARHPIYGELYSLDYFPDIPMARFLAARDGWLLVHELTVNLFSVFCCNPITKEKITLPGSNNAWRIDELLYFSGSPTSMDFLVVGLAKTSDSFSICYMKSIDEGWIFRDMSPYEKCLLFTYYKAFVLKDLIYFLTRRAELLVFDPEKDQIRLFEAPGVISRQVNELEWGQERYMLESDDGKLIAVFVGAYGNSVHTFEWNNWRSKWEIIRSLGNRMLFVSYPLSVCKTATVSGTENKIYFPRVAGDNGNILFYSLATGKYHTFEMGTTYHNFLYSKFYPQYNGWFMPA